MKNVLNNLKKFFKTDIKVINSYFLAITILVILVSVGLTSYALFSYARDDLYDNSKPHLSYSSVKPHQYCFHTDKRSGKVHRYIRSEHRESVP